MAVPNIKHKLKKIVIIYLIFVLLGSVIGSLITAENHIFSFKICILPTNLPPLGLCRLAPSPRRMRP